MSAINPLELSGSPGIITLESSLQKKKRKEENSLFVALYSAIQILSIRENIFVTIGYYFKINGFHYFWCSETYHVLCTIALKCI